MNQGRIWCVVNPTVGLPLFLGSVAITSLVVHGCVMTHTDWMSNYWEGKAKVAMLTSPAPAVQSNAAFTMSVEPVAPTASTPASFVVTVTPHAQAVQSVLPVAPAPIRTASAN